MASADEPSRTGETPGSPKSFKSAKSAGSPARSPPRPPSEHGSPRGVEANAVPGVEAEADEDQPQLEAEVRSFPLT